MSRPTVERGVNMRSPGEPAAEGCSAGAAGLQPAEFACRIERPPLGAANTPVDPPVPLRACCETWRARHL